MEHGQMQGLVSPSDIAKMAGRTRAAVSNWRANDRLGFPRPAGGTEARPLFNSREVTEWLRKRDITVQEDRGEIAAWSVLNAYLHVFDLETMTDGLLALLSAKALSRDDLRLADAWAAVTAASTDSLLGQYEDVKNRAEAVMPERGAALLALPTEILDNERGPHLVSDLVRVVGFAEGDALRQISDGVLARLISARARAGGEHGLVGSRISRLLAEMARTHDEVEVAYDPACGIGEALLAVHGVCPDAVLLGRDANSAAVRVASQRALLAGADVDLRVADSLANDPDPDLRADLVIVEPPLGASGSETALQLSDPRWLFGLPSRTPSEMLWIQDAVHRLRPGGRAYVVTSRGPLFRGGSEKIIRLGLLRAGCIEAIIGLPPRLLQHTSIPLSVWVLRPPGDVATRDVLFVDGTSVESPEDQVGQWLRLGSGASFDAAPPYSRVTMSDLLAEDAILQPERWTSVTEPDPEVVSEALMTASSLWEYFMIKQLPEFRPEWPVSYSKPRMISVGTLIEQGAVSLSRGSLKPDEVGSANAEPWAPADVRSEPVLEFPSFEVDVEGDDETPQVPLIEEFDGLTRPGDIVLSTTGEIRARVDKRGGRPVTVGLYRLRVDGRQLDPWYVAQSLMGDWNKRHQVGVSVNRADARDLEIPLLALDEQKRVAQVLRAADDGAQWARAVERVFTLYQQRYLDAIKQGLTVTKSENP